MRKEERGRSRGLSEPIQNRLRPAVNVYGRVKIAGAAVLLVAMATLTTGRAEPAPSEQGELDGWPPVPPLKDQTVIGNYCIHRNLIYSMGDVLCIGGQGLVCVPPSGTATGGRAYWSSAPVSRGDINWTPPAHCGK